MLKRLIALVLVVALLVAAYWWWRSSSEAAFDPAAALIPLLSEEDSSGFAQATEPGAVNFPEDLGAHNDYRTEWWYYTGNLEASEGRPFGFQLTFFRRALAPGSVAQGPEDGGRQSNWRTNQLYLAHFTVSDIAEDRFYSEERFSRGAAGLASAQSTPYRVWLENWSAEEIAPGVVRLRAESDDADLDLKLSQTLPPILHGDGGLSPKGPEPGNASYYYSIVQQEVAGSISVQGKSYPVTGLAWKDHEYSTSALSEGAVGWDWFSLQIDDGTALMFFQIRRDDGSLEPASSGSFIFADGKVMPLSMEQWNLEVVDRWTSPESGATYPAGWRISIPDLALELTGRPLTANQELNVSTVYWEGAVAWDGTVNGSPGTAVGYVELTGYAEAISGRS